MKRKMLGIIAGTMLLLTIGAGSALADNPNRTNPAEHLFSYWGPLQGSQLQNPQPIPEPGTSNNYSNLWYYQPHWPGAALPAK